MNNSSWGLMDMQEGFSKEMLEKTNYLILLFLSFQMTKSLNGIAITQV